VNNSRYFS